LRVGFIQLLLSLVMLAACSAAGPALRVSLSDPRAQYHFDAGTEDWQTFVMPGDQAVFRINDGALEGAVVRNSGYIWSLNSVTYPNLSIQATVQQTQGEAGNGFGILCRADAVGNGYYFLISSSGYFSIRKATPAQSDPIALVDWQASDAIHKGNEPNQLTAICVNDDLMFSINDRLVAEAHDGEFALGQPGVVIGAADETLWVRFDDIILRDAAVAG